MISLLVYAGIRERANDNVPERIQQYAENKSENEPVSMAQKKFHRTDHEDQCDGKKESSNEALYNQGKSKNVPIPLANAPYSAR